jgi:flagellar basal-body rod protein FlgG
MKILKIVFLLLFMGYAIDASELESLENDQDEQTLAIYTGCPCDIMIKGMGFLSVLLSDNTIAYTKDGHLNLNQEGRLIHSSGHPVLYSGYTHLDYCKIPLEAQIIIDRNGEIYYKISGQTVFFPSHPTLQIAKFDQESFLSTFKDTLFKETETSLHQYGSGPAQFGIAGIDGYGEILQYHLERGEDVIGELILSIKKFFPELKEK